MREREKYMKNFPKRVNEFLIDDAHYEQVSCLQFYCEKSQ